ncbi:hypothetical protein FTUN_8900 [Frigoriglobus tundricola]|uniref:Uncharacterized protein n=1 Tax=Frigoriglobus tundricola TaxID=2774151 RepID=A0A6M5Z4B2_9BACT|nr:hypothetical protein FTUN_8900 [Frigoriglobus tundricola]
MHTRNPATGASVGNPSHLHPCSSPDGPYGPLRTALFSGS